MTKYWRAGLVLLALAPPAEAQEPASNPHGHLRTAVDCVACHTADAWRPTRVPLAFAHDETRFVLEGRHGDVACTGCHLELRFDEPDASDADCVFCHVDVHVGRLGRVCTTCHSTTSFTNVPGLAVHARTSFPLTGAHVQLSCETCHADDRGGAFTTLEPECVACHEADYGSAQIIDHAGAGFSTDCLQCHTTLAWSHNAEFDHVAAANFDLVGAHGVLPCSRCHQQPGGGVPFSPTDQDDCIACHQDDYQGEHAGTGFPTTCLTCHDQFSWGDAVFTEHDAQYFPIFSGAHRNRWDGCQTCHAVPADFSSFACFACHEHSQDRMDDKHKEEAGYAYQSTLCLSCHPNGRAED